jgi:hypothetical protein
VARASLQINFAPPDALYAETVLPHQLRVWADQVSEIVFTLDLQRSRSAQFGTDWDDHVEAIQKILKRACERHPHARIGEVDYSPKARGAVADAFFGGREAPLKDFRGGPYYSYFYGLLDCSNPVVLHFDADMMFGGMSASWLDEAVALLASDEDALIINPQPGPPSPDGTMVESERYSPRRVQPGVYAFDYVSTRIFVVDLERLRARLGPLPTDRIGGLRMRLGALRARRTTHDLPENVLSRAMAGVGMQRLDMLGAPPGMWAIHPVTRDQAYYRSLARLVERTERGEVTPEQLGRYNVHQSMLEG